MKYRLLQFIRRKKLFTLLEDVYCPRKGVILGKCRVFLSMVTMMYFYKSVFHYICIYICKLFKMIVMIKDTGY